MVDICESIRSYYNGSGSIPEKGSCDGPKVHDAEHHISDGIWVVVAFHDKESLYVQTLVGPNKDHDYKGMLPSWMRKQIDEEEEGTLPLSRMPFLTFQIPVHPSSRIPFGLQGDTMCPMALPVLQKRDLPLIVDDVATDERLLSNPMIQFMKAKMLCLVPLKIVQGYRIGTVGIFDSKHRPDITLASTQFLEERKTELERIIQCRRTTYE